MDRQAVLAEVRSWPAEERLLLIGEVWDGLAEADAGPELSEELTTLLDRRLEALEANPDRLSVQLQQNGMAIAIRETDDDDLASFRL